MTVQNGVVAPEKAPRYGRYDMGPCSRESPGQRAKKGSSKPRPPVAAGARNFTCLGSFDSHFESDGTIWGRP